MEDAVRVADVTPSAVTGMITWERKTAVKHLPDMELCGRKASTLGRWRSSITNSRPLLHESSGRGRLVWCAGAREKRKDFSHMP
jgi:hypothetical protein